MKKFLRKLVILIIVLISVGIGVTYFVLNNSFTSYYVNDTKVGGYRFVTFSFEGHAETNGFAMWNIGSSYRLIKDEGLSDPQWIVCKKLDDALLLYLKNSVGSESSFVNTDLKFISEKTEYSYRAYILTNTGLYFVWGFPDFNGDPPQEPERNVCEIFG